MRRRGLTITICFLAVLALASIGFASWIITNPNTETVKPGEITVDDVTSQVFKIGASWDETSGGKINFGKPTDYEAKDSYWLTNDSETNECIDVSDGNIYNGLRAIYYNDVLRRTHGDPNMFQGVYADSLNASVIRVVLRYLIFDTPVI